MKFNYFLRLSKLKNRNIAVATVLFFSNENIKKKIFQLGI